MSFKSRLWNTRILVGTGRNYNIETWEEQKFSGGIYTRNHRQINSTFKS